MRGMTDVSRLSSRQGQVSRQQDVSYTKYTMETSTTNNKAFPKVHVHAMFRAHTHRHRPAQIQDGTLNCKISQNCCRHWSLSTGHSTSNHDWDTSQMWECDCKKKPTLLHVRSHHSIITEVSFALMNLHVWRFHLFLQPLCCFHWDGPIRMIYLFWI